MSIPSNNAVAFVTGASRGIGAATALKLAESGCDVVVNYRSKSARAQEVANRIEQLGRRALVVQADLTNEAELGAMLQCVRNGFERIDILVLNASGGLEKGKSADYAMALNHFAQLRVTELVIPLMTAGGSIVFVTSHWAHFHGQRPNIPGYEAIAESKHAGEQALRQYVQGLNRSDLKFLVVSGDAIEGTITPRLLQRRNPDALDKRGTDEPLPTVDEFADAIAQAALQQDLPSGSTIFVGPVAGDSSEAGEERHAS